MEDAEPSQITKTKWHNSMGIRISVSWRYADYSRLYLHQIHFGQSLPYLLEHGILAGRPRGIHRIIIILWVKFEVGILR
jgi:hypothetical protein